MFRDRERELRWLEEQLLEEEEEDEELLDDETVENLLGDTDQARDPGIYQNYSNDYGRKNPAADYKVYNTDRVDVDLEQFSEQVRNPRKKSGCTGFLVLLLLLMIGVLGWMVWQYWKMGGFL